MENKEDKKGTFESIYEEYFPRVYMFLYRMCNNDHLAEELTQETFFQAFRSFHRFRGESEMFTWLASIAKFTFFGYIRKHKKESEIVNIDIVTDRILEGDENDPEKILQRSETSKAIRRLVGKIPEKYRDVVILRVYAELPFSEIAESLKISESSAKVLYFRAKKMLMEELKNEHLV